MQGFCLDQATFRGAGFDPATWSPVESVTEGAKPLPKPNYRFLKRQKDLAKKQKQAEKAQRKLERAANPDAGEEPMDEAPEAGEESTDEQL